MTDKKEIKIDEAEVKRQKEEDDANVLSAMKIRALNARIESGDDKRGEPTSKESLAIVEAKDLEALEKLTQTKKPRK